MEQSNTINKLNIHMSFTTQQITTIKEAAAKYLYYNRPPIDIRDQLDIGYRIKEQSVFVFEIRPDWQNKEVKIETPVAKTTFNKSKNMWKTYWMRGDLKWYHYEAVPFVESISDFFYLVAKDELNCFFG